MHYANKNNSNNFNIAPTNSNINIGNIFLKRLLLQNLKKKLLFFLNMCKFK